MKNDIIIYGSSGHGKVIMDAILSRNEKVARFADDNTAIHNFMGLDVVHDTHKEHTYVIAIGDNATRKKVVKKVRGNFSVAIIHHSAILSRQIKIGPGSVVLAAAVINNSAIIQEHVIINTAAVIEHDCVIESYAHISPNATLCGNVTVGEGTHVGAAATVLPNLNIGKWCTIGAGAVVITDVPDGATVVGNPGRIIKKDPCPDY